MSGNYTFEIDRERRLVDVAPTGFWEPDSTAAFCNELLMHITTLRKTADYHVLLCDLSQAVVAPSETIAVLGQILAHPALAGLKTCRMALYTPSALLRLQMSRLTGVRDSIGVFETRAAAETWLMASSAVAA